MRLVHVSCRPSGIFSVDIEGGLLKMEGRLQGNRAHYVLPLGEERVEMNALVGQRVRLSYGGFIRDVLTGELIKKSYGEGYSYRNFTSLARCDLCIVKPHLCHFERGTCREPQWGKDNCLVNHVVYLSETSSVKVGITREANIPGRWIDQGAFYALGLVGVRDRLTSGLIEQALAREYNDRTSWQQMLSLGGSPPPQDVHLKALGNRILEDYCDLMDDMEARELEGPVVTIHYPVVDLPPSLRSLSLEKTPRIEGTLLGIKGQYLLFPEGALNVRKHQGYQVRLESI